MRAIKNPKVISALQRIEKQNNGVISPELVVDAARPKTSPLHRYFEWDDTEAAERYRLWQARRLLRVVVQMVDIEGESQPMNVYVSLNADRKEGGYRSLVTVLSDEQQREQLLADALEELQLFKEKYKQLTELAEVFAAAEKVQIKPKKLAA